MPVDFSDIDLTAIADDAAKKTDAQLAGQISSLTRMTDAEITALFPRAPDAKRLVELMQIVRAAENDKHKVKRIADNSERFAGVILKLLTRFV